MFVNRKAEQEICHNEDKMLSDIRYSLLYIVYIMYIMYSLAGLDWVKLLIIIIIYIYMYMYMYM